jgi:pimeloyl-ACP methyl ester carboxylesterase
MIKYATFKGIRVRFSDTGKGRALVLIHGFPETLQVWEEFSIRLARHFRVIALDLPGHGETPSIGYIHSTELFAESVKTVMDSLALRRYVVVGHSMGGYVALAFAELYPDKVSGLCLFHSSVVAETADKKKDRDRVIALVKKEKKHYLNEVVTSLFAPANVSVYKEEIRELRHIAQGISLQGLVNALEGMKDRPSRDWVVEQAKYPILFIIGKKDRVFAADMLSQQAAQIQRAQTLVLESGGHMGFIEEKKICQDGLLQFVRTCFRKTGARRAKKNRV